MKGPKCRVRLLKNGPRRRCGTPVGAPRGRLHDRRPMTNAAQTTDPDDDFFEGRRRHIDAVHWRWLVFLARFARAGPRVEILNRRTGTSFRCFQNTLADSVLLQLAKLLDPKEMGKGKYKRHPVSLYRAV